MGFAYHTALDLTRLIAAKKISPVELVEDVIELARDVREEARGHGGATTGDLAREHLVEHDADGVEVGAPLGSRVVEQAVIADGWTAEQAIRTPQFVLMLVCGIAYAMPWNTAVAHLTLHLMDVGYAEAVAIGFVGVMVLFSKAGRLLGVVGDWMSPHVVLASALGCEGIGAGGLLFAANTVWTTVAVALLGIGFGMAFVSIPVVFSHFFGRRAFAITSGIRMTITGVVGGLGPWLAGLAFDANGSYTVPFIGLMMVGFAGAASAAAMRHPGAPPVSA